MASVRREGRFITVPVGTWFVYHNLLGASKWVVALVWLWAFSPAWAWIGFAIGALLDCRLVIPAAALRPGEVSLLFLRFASIFIQLDDAITRGEIRYVFQYLTDQFGRDVAEARMHVLDSYLRTDFDLDYAIHQARESLDDDQIEELLRFLFGLAFHSGSPGRNELRAVFAMGRRLDLSDEQIKAIYGGYRGRQDSKVEAEVPLVAPKSDYDVLGISPSAEDADIRRAYYRLSKKYHPDRVLHLEPARQRKAKEKFQEISAAYQRIRQSRGKK